MIIINAGELLRVTDAAVIILVVGATATVVRLHWAAWRRCPTKVGLTPLHVAMVASGVLVWGATLAWAILDTIGREVTAMAAWRMGLYGVGAVLILAALAVMASIQRRRVQFGRTDDEVVVMRRTDSVEITGPDTGNEGDES